LKLLQIVPREGARLFRAILGKQAEIRRKGRGTFSRVGPRSAKSAKWSHVRYRGSIMLKAAEKGVDVRIRSPDPGDEARLLSSFLGWLDRHFGDQVTSVTIQYQPPVRGRRK
jgi:hypothetical protein